MHKEYKKSSKRSNSGWDHKNGDINKIVEWATPNSYLLTETLNNGQKLSEPILGELRKTVESL